MTTIYKITNKLNGKIYIGQTRQTIEKRFMQHAAAKTPLGHAMQNCGLENFTIEVIEECETPEQTKERERFWIRVLKCKVPTGYNQSDGGERCAFTKKKRSFVVFMIAEGRIATSLKRFRKKFGLNQKEVAKLLGITSQAYQNYEYGKGSPTAAAIIKLAQEFNVTSDYLLGLSDSPQPTDFDEEEVRKAFALRDAVRAATTGQVNEQ